MLAANKNCYGIPEGMFGIEIYVFKECKTWLEACTRNFGSSERHNDGVNDRLGVIESRTQPARAFDSSLRKGIQVCFRATDYLTPAADRDLFEVLIYQASALLYLYAAFLGSEPRCRCHSF